MKKRLSKAIKIPLFLLLGVVGLLVALTFFNALMTRIEKASYQIPGQLVEVSGKKIHVYTVGSGAPNVVLLSGLGTPFPLLDFQGLVRALQAKVRVTVLEYPGYGLSDDTDASRSTANSVAEIRAALQAAQVLPPYFLVPHSISGLQSLYYADKYPQEVAGIVGLDSSVPEQANYFQMPHQSFNVDQWWRRLGITRVALMFAPSLSGATSMGLSAAEVSDYNRVTNWVVVSHAVFNESNEINANMRALADTKFPSSLPVVFVLASESVTRTGPGIPGADWKAMHEKLVDNNPKAKVLVLEGEHYIHHKNAGKIADLILEVAGINR
jgi:pimeloyl-ACP methyl ester carboxylesterase